MNLQRSVVLLIVVLFWTACKKDEASDPNPPISDVPAIEIVSLSSSSINQFDDLTFTISYQDGNGDIGDENADAAVVFITDNRASITHEFHVPPLAPAGESIAIQGNLLVVLENVILLDQNNTSESATFTVRLQDRSGNSSNEVVSSSVTINQ